MITALTTRFRPLHKLLVGGAWLFIIFTLVNLAWVVGVKIDDPEGITRLFSAAAGSEIVETWGLNYTDTGGLIQALLQIAAVIFAATASTLPAKSDRRLKWKRLGHLVLTVWAAWWAMNLVLYAGQAGTLSATMQAGLLTSMFAATLYRAGFGFCRRHCQTVEPANDEPRELPTTPDDAPKKVDTKPVHLAASPTHAFFAAIAPPPQPVESFEVEITVTEPTEVKPSIWARLRDRFRTGGKKVHEHVNREKLVQLKDKANHAAHHGHDFVVKKGGGFVRRAKPVAKTALREARNAWRKTIDAVKDAEHAKTGETPAATAEHVA